MKIVFPMKDGDGLESSVYTDFGTAPSFFWCDTESGEHGNADNDGCEEDDGGKSSVISVSELGAEVVIAKEVGCAAVNRFRGFQIEVYCTGGGSISADIELFKSGKLRRMFAGECDGSCKV